MAISPTPRIVRPLGHFERLMCARNVLDTYFGTSLSCRYGIPEHLRSEDAQPRLQTILVCAVASTVLQHPLMQVGLVNASRPQPAYAQLDSIDLEKQITWVVGDWDEAAHEQFISTTTIRTLDKAFAEVETRPGWTITVMRRSPTSPSIDILLNWNHPHFDGTGSKIFHRSLLKSLNTQLRSGTAGDASAIPLRGHILIPNVGTEDNPMLPPNEDLAPPTVAFPFIIKTLMDEFKPPWLSWLSIGAPKNPDWAPTGLLPGTPYATALRGFSIDPQTLSRILGVCRAHRTTLTALVHGVIFTSLVPALNKRGITLSTIESQTPINLRGFAESSDGNAKPGHDDSIMCFVSAMSHYFPGDLTSTLQKAAAMVTELVEEQQRAKLERFVWDAAALVKQDIDDRVQARMNNEPSALLKYVDNAQRYYKQLLEKPRHYAWLVTNIGVLDGRDAASRELPESTSPTAAGDTATPSSWEIQRGLFTLSADLTGPFFQVSTVTVKGGDLTVNLTWPRGVADDTIGDDLAKDMEEWLQLLGKKV